MKPNPIVSCQSKKSYATFEKAQETANWLFKEKKVEVYPYRCFICEMFHLSSR